MRGASVASRWPGSAITAVDRRSIPDCFNPRHLYPSEGRFRSVGDPRPTSNRFRRVQAIAGSKVVLEVVSSTLVPAWV
jgi:hypothetical protein